MKKWMIGVSVVAIALVTVASAFVYIVLRPVARADTAAGFANGMREYAVEHSLLLPETWSDYLEWGKRRHNWDIPESRMDGAYLEALYVVRHRDVGTGLPDTVYIEVIDPQLKHMEGFINRTLASARHERKSEQNVGDNAIYTPSVER